MATPDVTVVGQGIFGLSIAYVCASRGASVCVVESRSPGAGSSGGTVGALAPHTPENWNSKKQFQLDSLLMAETFWAELDTVSGLSSGYGRIGRLQSIDTDRALDLARKRTQGATALWQGKASWKVVGSNASWAPKSATGLLVHDTLSARLHPTMACQSLARALEILGVSKTDKPKGNVVWATGFEGLLHLSEMLGRPVGNGVKGQSLSLKYDAGDLPQLYADGLHIVPHVDGSVGIGSTSERDWHHPTLTDDALDELHSKAVTICPALANAPVLRRWAGIRPRAKSRAPMLGEWPGRPNNFIANGGFKIGFGMAPKVAEVMSDLVLEGRDRIPDGFRVDDSL